MSRSAIAATLDRRDVGGFLTAVIIFNAVLLGLETYPAVMARAGGVIHALDKLCLAIFVVELLAKLYALGPRFFRSGWNVFDFIVVGLSLLPAGQGLSVIRALRVLRVLRLISIAPSLRRVVDGFVIALPGMASVFLLLGIIFYIGSVMATQLYGGEFPERFGDLAGSALTLFQVMTMEGWADGVVRPVMENHPYAWTFFIPFILVTTFAVVNLLVGLVVNAMEQAGEADREADEDAFNNRLMARLDAIERKLDGRG